MENFKNYKVEFFDENINDLVNGLNYAYSFSQTSFAHLCFSVRKIIDYFKNNYIRAKDDKYYSSTLLLNAFGFTNSTISKLNRSFDYFCELLTKEVPIVKDFYRSFSPSKLFELLPLSLLDVESAIEKSIITPDLSVKEIRKIVKQIVNGDPAVNVSENLMEFIDESEIPMAYNPTQVYSIDYFKKQSKNQLINIVLQLQDEFQKLKLNKEKK